MTPRRKICANRFRYVWRKSAVGKLPKSHLVLVTKKLQLHGTRRSPHFAQTGLLAPKSSWTLSHVYRIWSGSVKVCRSYSWTFDFSDSQSRYNIGWRLYRLLAYNYSKVSVLKWQKKQRIRKYMNNLTVFRRSSATNHLSVHDEREHQSRQICSVSRCTSQSLWTVETRCQYPHLWWSAALNSFSHKTLSLHSNSALHRRCRSNSSDRSRCNRMMWCCRR